MLTDGVDLRQVAGCDRVAGMNARTEALAAGATKNNFKKLKHFSWSARLSLRLMTLREQELTRQLEQCPPSSQRVTPRERSLLRQKIDLLVKRVSGSSSRRLDKNQLELLAQESNLSAVSTVASIVAAPEKERVRAFMQGTSGAPAGKSFPWLKRCLIPNR